MNSYELSRNYFNWCFENPEKVNTNHTAIYFFAIEHCNRLGWKEKFGFPSQMAMEALGIKSYNTYINAFNDLVSFGFIELIEKSKNQYSANIIALSNNDKAPNKALDKALTKHSTKQRESTSESNYSINKQLTIEQLNTNQDFTFDEFWKLYPNKIAKAKCEPKFNKLTNAEKLKIKETLNAFISYKPFNTYTHPNPEAYLNQKRWDDVIPKQIELIPNDNRSAIDQARQDWLNKNG